VAVEPVDPGARTGAKVEWDQNLVIDIVPRDPTLPAAGATGEDTDGDGIPDTWTSGGGTFAEDWDGDGVTDAWYTEETLVERDRDGDGRVDLRGASGGSLAEDTDGDGQADLWETWGGWSEEDTDGDGIFATSVADPDVIATWEPEVWVDPVLDPGTGENPDVAIMLPFWTPAVLV
jgi:hypothetical protein